MCLCKKKSTRSRSDEAGNNRKALTPQRSSSTTIGVSSPIQKASTSKIAVKKEPSRTDKGSQETLKSQANVIFGNSKEKPTAAIGAGGKPIGPAGDHNEVSDLKTPKGNVLSREWVDVDKDEKLPPLPIQKQSVRAKNSRNKNTKRNRLSKGKTTQTVTVTIQETQDFCDAPKAQPHEKHEKQAVDLLEKDPVKEVNSGENKKGEDEEDNSEDTLRHVEPLHSDPDLRVKKEKGQK